jgi:2-(1,2-epoxy-1,2-dihydrophenyl)acetyl-CoA isomerase
MSLVLIDWDAERGIATLTLNRPEVLNAISVDVAESLRDQARTLPDRAGLRCVVLCGAGRAFVAGGDLGGFAADFDQAGDVAARILDAMHEVLQIFAGLDAPVLASVKGVAAGAGLALVAACDLVIAAEGTRFLTAYDRIGASPDCGSTYYLPRVMGPRRSAQFYLLGETLDTQEAQRLGLVSHRVEAGQLEAETAQLAAKLAAGPTAAFGRFKRLMASSLDRGLADQLAAEKEQFIAGSRTGDFREGISAFLQKRPAKFEGC